MVDEEFESVPRITLDEEDIAQRHSRRAANVRGVDGGMGESPVIPAAAVMAVPVSKRILMGLGLAALFALVSIVWLFLSLQNSAQQLATATARIDQLEARLVSTDTTMTKSEVLLADKLRSMDQLIDANKGEIRKLWGLAGDTQRKAIEQARVTNDQQNATLKNLQELLAANGQKLDVHQVTLDQLVVVTKNSEASSREAVQRMEIAQEKVGVLDNDVKNIRQKQSQQEVDYGKRIATLEDTAKSTDVFRRNTQEELRKLRDELLRQNAPVSKSNP